MSVQIFPTSFAPPTPMSESPFTPQPLCPGDVPLVLFPVRLETRFVTPPSGSTELRVRIYPDRIHVDTHHKELTTDERAWGTQYWEQDWLAGNDATRRMDAWRILADRFSAERAAWIARLLQPTNLTQRPKDPVPSGTTPPFTPVFPTLPPVGLGGEHAWRQAPLARLLPDRWVAMVHSAGGLSHVVTSNDIVGPLAVGPDPEAPELDEEADTAIGAGDRLALDDEMLWMVDFEAAVEKGMALRIPLSATELATPIDRLIVLGVAASPDTSETAAQLADLLDAHHYTDGLEFLRFGSPTNNTDDRRAAFSSEDPGHARSFSNEVTSDPASSPNAVRVGTALGLPTDRIAPTLGRIGQAGQDHDHDMRSMNAALWQVGWGYALSNMWGPESKLAGSSTGLSPAGVQWARGHFLDFVRGGGPFPALRVGTQPYGILPVTSLGLSEPTANEDLLLRGMLLTLREGVWRPAANRTARIGLRPEGAPDADLADVMRTDGVSHGYHTRGVLGRHYLEHLHSFNALDLSGPAQTQAALADSILMLLGLSREVAQRPRLLNGFLSDSTFAMTAPLVQAGEISPWKMLEPNYIEDLLRTPKTIEQLIATRPLPAATDRATSLLQVLLRQSMLREIATAAARYAAKLPGKDLATLLRDLELVDLVDAPPVNHTLHAPPETLHWRRQLDLRGAPGVPDDQTIGEFIEGLTDFATSEVEELGEFRKSLAHLCTLDTESLQLLTQATLDLSSYRLDAWITSVATKRLAAMRSAAPTGLRVGGYGWVENLRRVSPQPEPLPAAAMPPGEQERLYALANDSGFIHAPSMAHAATAALLRNAHLGPSGIPSQDGPFAIDLSSHRVREASRLLDGVRQGQPLGALLGYRLERRLHDLGLDHYITPLRGLAPLAVRERESDAGPAEAIAANNVVDGLVLLRFRGDSDDQSLSNALHSVAGTIAERDLVRGEIEALVDAVDGLSDGLTAEAAYQIVRGNSARLGSTLSAIAHGEALPPELEVVRMPRSGDPQTHRVVVLFSGTSNAGPGWSTSSRRATLERWLNAWIGAQLGDARTIRCTVEQLDGTGAVVRTVHFPFTNVPMGPLDFVYNVQPAGPRSATADALSVNEQLVLYHARRMTDGFGAEATIRLQHARPTDLAPGETTLFDLLQQARAIRRWLEGARGLRPGDLSPPDRASKGTIDLAGLESRVLTYENGLNAVYKALAALLPKATTTPAEDLRIAMLKLGEYGIEPAVPHIAVGDTPDIRVALAGQSAGLVKIATARMDRVIALRTQAVAADQRARCDQLIERARAVYGAEFVVLPNFTCETAAATELTSALAASTQQQGGDPLAVHSWFMRASRVRDPLSRLGVCLQEAEALGRNARLNLSVAQLPFVSTERWVGLPPDADVGLPPNKLSLVVQRLTPINPALVLCGLLVDEWVEVVPAKEETTAITFQCDPPNAFAPQSVLVAVPPVAGQSWDTETLRQVLLETLDLAKLRAVDPSLLGAAAQYLPGLYVPFNVADDAVSTDFRPLTA